MAARVLVSLSAAATVLAGLPPASHAEVELPRKNCAKRIADPEGDGNVYLFPPTVPMPTGPKADGLDITGVHLRLTATELQVLLAIKNIPNPPEMQPTDSAYRYVVTFKFEAKTFTFEAVHVSPNHNSAFPPNPSQYPKANTGSTQEDALPGFTGVVDAATEYVTFTAPRDRVEHNLARALVDGDQFTGIVGRTYHHRFGTVADSDFTAVPADQAVWTVGDDYCFGAPPASLSALTAKNVQYGDATTVSAKLVAESGAALAGKPVQFAIAGDPSGVHTATTNAAGVATATFVPKVAAAAKPYAVTATFAGDATDGKATATGSVAVSAEKTTFAALRVAKTSATTRTVTATLQDDDRKAVAGVKVDWLVNGRKVATQTTSSRGQVVYKGAKAGQYVQARFAGVAGKYLAATSARTRV